MSDVIIPQRFLIRGGTASDLATVNETPKARELILETDTGRLKRGDGSKAYNDLPYIGPGEIDFTGVADGKVLAWDAANSRFKLVSGSDGGGGWTMLSKMADTVRVSTTALADDPDLTIALSASTLYAIRGIVYFNQANGTMGNKIAFAYSGTTTSVASNWLETIVSAAVANNITYALTSAALPSAAGGGGGAGMLSYRFDVSIKTNTAGTLSFQWAQNTSNAGDLTLKAGSYLEVSAL